MSRQSEWKKRNRPAMTAYRKKWMKKNPKKRKEYEDRYINKHRDQVNARRRAWRKRTNYDQKRHRKIRERVIKKYGGKCVCCGISIYEFLSFDHINGRGRQHREHLRLTGQKLVTWLDSHDKRADIQILCHNCNQSLGHYGLCPHHPDIKRMVIR